MSVRSLPSVDRLVQEAQPLAPPEVSRSLLVEAARAELAGLRADIMAAGGTPPLPVNLAERVVARAAELLRPSLRPVINATGVILQTNLGRAPLSAAALAAMQTVGQGYSNLEYDLEAGERGSRAVHLVAALQRLTGAEDALVVNNNAAAVYLALAALAAGREVLVSRAQAVEIGGGFRIPDVLRQSGATLVEVGTTNRTYVRDYAEAISERTALLLRVHSSNFRLVGFVHQPQLHELAALAHARGVALVDDLGSGTLLPTTPYGLAAEPTVQESVAAGADLVTFSGDKLLGGPQAGLMVGRAATIALLRRHPLARALRVDKTTIAGLEATLAAYTAGRALAELPVWRMISMPVELVRQRAELVAGQLRVAGLPAQVASCEATVGGGAVPGETLPSAAVALALADLAGAALRLRMGAPAIVGRIADGRLLLDMRTVLPEQEPDLVVAVRQLLGKDGA